MGLFGGDQTTSTSVTLNPQQKQLAKYVTPLTKQYLNPKNSAKLKITGDTVANFTNTQKKAQQLALGAAGGQADIAGSAKGASSMLLNKDILSADSNPALRSYIDAATRPITDQLMESVLPGVRSGAAGAGQYGSSRQAIAEGIASGKASRAVGDTAANIANQGYQTGLDAMTKALGLAPATQAMQTIPAATVAGVGDAQQQQRQKEIDANRYKRIYNATIPLSKAQNVTALVSGLPGGGTTTSSTGTTGLLQGALGGASLGSVLSGALGLAPGVGTLGGAGLGAVLSQLG